METMAIDVKGLEVKRRLQDLERARVTNTWRTVRFRLDGQMFERRLVLYPLDDPAGELNVASPVGRALLLARAGEELTVAAPGGDVIVEVLEVR